MRQTTIKEDNAIKAIRDIISSTETKDPMRLVRKAISDTAISRLNKVISECDDCQLSAPIKTIGYGNPNASVMIIGDYPLQAQISQSKKILRPFEGTRNLVSLETFFSQLGVNSEELFWMNSMNCYPLMDNMYRCPNTKEIKACSVYMKYAVDIIRPAMITLVGAVALNCFKSAPMSSAHGQWIDAFTIPAMPVYSPAHINQLEMMDNYPKEKIQAMKNDMIHDFKNAFRYLQDNFPDNNVLTKRID